MDLKDLIGQTLTQVEEPDAPDNDVIFLHFGNTVVQVAAVDSSEPGTGGCVSLYVKVKGKVKGKDKWIPPIEPSTNMVGFPPWMFFTAISYGIFVYLYFC